MYGCKNHGFFNKTQPTRFFFFFFVILGFIDFDWVFDSENQSILMNKK